MSLIGENCKPCRSAAEADNRTGGGLAGRWWRGWARAADASGYIGAGIVGGFALLVALWYLIGYIGDHVRARKHRHAEHDPLRSHMGAGDHAHDYA